MFACAGGRRGVSRGCGPSAGEFPARRVALTYTRMTKPDRLASLLSLAIVFLSIAAAVLSLFPATDWYRDANPWSPWQTTTVGTPWVVLFALPAAFALRKGTMRWALVASDVVLAAIAAVLV